MRGDVELFRSRPTGSGQPREVDCVLLQGEELVLIVKDEIVFRVQLVAPDELEILDRLLDAVSSNLNDRRKIAGTGAINLRTAERTERDRETSREHAQKAFRHPTSSTNQR